MTSSKVRRSPEKILLPRGFSFSALAAGIKVSGRPDLALVEIAASLGTALQVFFFSSALADFIERGKTSRGRNAWAIVFAVLLIAFYSFTRYFPEGAR